MRTGSSKKKMHLISRFGFSDPSAFLSIWANAFDLVVKIYKNSLDFRIGISVAKSNAFSKFDQ